MRKGLSLIELVISLGIFALIVLVVTNIFIGVFRFNKQEQSRILVGDEATRIFSTIDETLRQGKSILTNATISGTTYTTSNTTVVLTWPSLIAGSPSATETDTVVLTYNASTKQIQQIISPDPSSSRTANSGIVMTDAADAFFRYTTDDPTQSTALSLIVLPTATVGQQSFTQPAILYETLRNHP